MGDQKKSIHVKVKDGIVTINAMNMHYRNLNSLIKAHNNPIKEIHVRKVYGQRYIGTGLKGSMELHLYGTPGNDLAAFMDGPSVYVHGNAQDGVGNTMNSGKVVVYGHSGDITGYSMRGGKIFVRDDVGYRTGIHMKEYQDVKPTLVIGGSARDFLGEYMAGGIILVLGLNLQPGQRHESKFVGSGMHGGVIYTCADMAHLGKEVAVMPVDENDVHVIQGLVEEFCSYFSLDFDEVMKRKFVRIAPVSHRPYGRLYA